MGKKVIPLIVLFISISFGKILEVCKKCEFKSIKEALKFAKNGDTIVIREGYYREGEIVIDKSVRLIGENFPVIDGEFRYEVIKIVADNVVVRGLKIVNSGRSEIRDLAGLKIENAKNCIIENNVFENNFWALYLAGVKNCKVINNKIFGPSEVSSAYSGNGIHAWNSENLLIKDNTVRFHRDGIYLEFVKDSVIEGNLVEDNWRYGLHFMFSHDNVYRKNTFRRNGAGAAVMYTKRVKMEGNVFENNWGSSSYGLLLKAIDDSIVIRNVFYKNTYAILLDECQRTEIKFNDFIENGWALRIFGNSANNIIINNNFISNTFDVSTNTSFNPNKIEKNYWSSYRGFDLDGDGFGEIPYRPVKLFSYMVENNPATIVLLRSFFVRILEVVEEMIPAITPVEIYDPKPRIKKVLWKR